MQFARVSKGNRVFAVAILLVGCLLAILITPTLVLWLFPRQEGELPFAWMIMMLVLLIVIPLVVGRALQNLILEHAPKLGLWLGRLSIVIFIIAAVTAGSFRARSYTARMRPGRSGRSKYSRALASSAIDV